MTPGLPDLPNSIAQVRDPRARPAVRSSTFIRQRAVPAAREYARLMLSRRSTRQLRRTDIIETWRGVVNTIAMRVQNVDELDDSVAGTIARRLTTKPDYDTPEQHYADLAYAVEHGTELTRIIQQDHSELVFRQFLACVLQHMDALRPWPTLPFQPLRTSAWSSFEDARPVAQIELSWIGVQERLQHAFYHPENDPHKEVLLLKMASGLQLALVADEPRSSIVTVLALDPDIPPDTVVTELVEKTSLQRDNITVPPGFQ